MSSSSQSGEGYGSGLTSTALTSEKTADVEPMPSAAVKTIVAVSPGCVRATRGACLKSPATPAQPSPHMFARVIRHRVSFASNPLEQDLYIRELLQYLTDDDIRWLGGVSNDDSRRLLQGCELTLQHVCLHEV